MFRGTNFTPLKLLFAWSGIVFAVSGTLPQAEVEQRQAYGPAPSSPAKLKAIRVLPAGSTKADADHRI
jgi:hypothetical protein